MSAVLGFIIVVIATPAVVKMAGGFNSPIKDELLVTQNSKAGTCSLGSIAIVLAVGMASVVSKNPAAMRLVALSMPFFLIGLGDDIMKIAHRSGDGFSSLTKLFLQLAASSLVAYLLRDATHCDLDAVVYYPLVVLFIATSVNALNITDGLDGLATKVTMPPVMLVAMAVPGLRSANLILFMVLAGYLIYNTGKARIFMGDGGSHFLGAFIALDALLSGNPAGVVLSIVLIYIELLSSLIQIIAIRCFHRKVFLIAPLHHDLEQRGFGEGRIVDTFFVITIFTSLLSAIFFFRVV